MTSWRPWCGLTLVITIRIGIIRHQFWDWQPASQIVPRLIECFLNVNFSHNKFFPWLWWMKKRGRLNYITCICTIHLNWWNKASYCLSPSSSSDELEGRDSCPLRSHNCCSPSPSPSSFLLLFYLHRHFPSHQHPLNINLNQSNHGKP